MIRSHVLVILCMQDTCVEKDYKAQVEQEFKHAARIMHYDECVDS